MADIQDERSLSGFSGRIGRSLTMEEVGDGRWSIRALERPDGVPAPRAAWEAFQDAVSYARRAQHQEEYLRVAEARNASPLEVATADFLHAPEVHRIDLEEYHGRPGDRIRIFATDDVAVTRVGVLILDRANVLVEMGMAEPGTDPDEWVYTATRETHSEHVRVVVDAADLPGHLTEGRAEKRKGD